MADYGPGNIAKLDPRSALQPEATAGSKSSPISHLLAGAVSGISSAVLLQPADLLKTRVQQSHPTSLTVALRTITSGPHPLKELWRGTLPSALRTGVGVALYFSALNALRSNLARTTTPPCSSSSSSSSASLSTSAHPSSALPKLTPTANLLTGAVARTGVGMLLMPVTVLKVRFESNRYAYGSLLGASRDILKTEGVRALFKGWGATAARDAPYAGLFLVFYEANKGLSARLLAPGGGGAGAGEPAEMRPADAAMVNFASSSVAAALATAVTNPFDAVKTRIQLSPGRYGNMFKAMAGMVRSEGWRVLFDGLGLRMGRKAASSALAWTVYEDFIKRVERSFKQETIE